MNQRGWTWIKDAPEGDEESLELTSASCDELARQWSELNNEIEQESFRRQAAIEDGEYDGPDFETQEELTAWRKVERIRQQTRRTKLEVLENMLEALGARMMRPYEHWNEDEKLMEYLERDRD